MKTLLVDLDGVLNTYKGDYKSDYIPPIREGAREFLEYLNNNEYEVKVFTTRNKELAEKWLEENGLKDLILYVTNHKEKCYLMIDDRCVTFKGNYEETIEEVKNFKPWHS